MYADCWSMFLCFMAFWRQHNTTDIWIMDLFFVMSCWKVSCLHTERNSRCLTYRSTITMFTADNKHVQCLTYVKMFVQKQVLRFLNNADHWHYWNFKSLFNQWTHRPYDLNDYVLTICLKCINKIQYVFIRILMEQVSTFIYTLTTMCIFRIDTPWT